MTTGETNLKDAVAWCAAHGTGGFVDDSGPHSWSEILAQSVAFARQLPPAARAVVSLPQRASGLALLCAVNGTGAATVVVSELYGEERARAVLERANADYLVSLSGDALAVSDQRLEAAPRDDRGESLIVMTSGTTSEPKLVRHSWSVMLETGLRRDDLLGCTWLCAYPIAQYAGLQVLAQVLRCAGNLLVPKALSPAAGFEMMSRQAAGFLSCTPTYLRQLLLYGAESDWRGLKLQQITLGGESTDQALLDAVATRLPGVKVTHIYASTELGPILRVSDGKAGFDARLVDDRRLRIVDGELFVRRGDQSMRSDLDGAPLPEWFGTGDLVELRDGRVLFRGRRTDIINVGGAKVMPAEVEAIIRAVPGVAECQVVGHPSPIAGHIVKALIVLAPGAARSDVDKAIRESCARVLPAHMVPRLVAFQDELTKTISQKIQRSAVEATARGQSVR